MIPLNNNTKQTIVAAGLLFVAVVYALLGIADPPSSTTITNEAVSSYLFRTGQRMVVRSNMTETVVQNASIASVLELSTTRQYLIGNGSDSTLVTAAVFDVSGSPVPDGQPVEFVTTDGAFATGSDTVYTLTVGGVARVWLKSAFLRGSGTQALVTARTYGASGRIIARTLPVTFFVAAVSGAIVSASRRDISGLVVMVVDASGREAGRDTIGSSGSFFVPVNQSGIYSLRFHFRTAFNDELTVQSSALVEVPAVGGVAPVKPLNTVIGSLVDPVTEQPVKRQGIPVMLYRTSVEQSTAGRQLPAMTYTDGKGTFVFDSLGSGDTEIHVIDVRYAGRLAVRQLQEGRFIVDAHVVVADAPTFEITKTSDKRIAEIGDVVHYTVELLNASPNASLYNVRLIDQLPQSFIYVRGSARREGQEAPDPPDQRKMRWMMADTLAPGRRVKMSYAAQIGAGGLQSDGVNRAYAVADRISGDSITTLVASARVVVRPGVFTDRGIVIGKVFYDANENGLQDNGEPGIPRVELLMEDGTRILTGDDGKYSLPEVRPGQHVIRLNQLTLPFGATPLALRSEFAGDGASRFVRLVDGGIARADFYIAPARQASLSVLFERSGNGAQATYILQYHHIGTPAKVSLVDTLPAGFAFNLASITWKGGKIHPDGKPSRSLLINFPERKANSSDTIRVAIAADSSASGKEIDARSKLVLTYASGKDAVFTGSLQQRTMPTIAASVPLTPAKVETTKQQALADTTQVIAQHRVLPVDTLSANVAKSPALAAVKARPAGGRQKAVRKITSTAVEADTVSVDSSGQLPGFAAQDSLPSAPTHERDITHLLAVIGVAGVVTLLVFLVFRRKRKEEGKQ